MSQRLWLSLWAVFWSAAAWNTGARAQTRLEFHLWPAVSTGPLDPAFSPDGAWIAFSMRGDIWKVPATGGDALALTQGPAYHFQPAWSPDGSRVAFSFDLGRNLDLGVVSSKGGPVSRLTTDVGEDIEPAWSADGQAIYFASRRGLDLDLYRLELATGALSVVVGGRGHQYQASISPDGKSLAYMAPVNGQIGSGGLWLRSLDGDKSRLVHSEETSYRAQPVWTRDGTGLLFVSDQAGSNDLSIVSLDGGSPVRLTDHPMDELSPSPSPDGSTVAFVSNHRGRTTLYTHSLIPSLAGSGRRQDWREVAIRVRRPRVATGRLRGRILGPDGDSMPARLFLQASDGRSYAQEDGFHRFSWANGTHYSHVQGSFEIEVPAGRTHLEVIRGFEYRPATATVDVPANGIAEVELRLERLVDLPELGWYSGDTHTHDLHEGRYGLTQEDFFHQAVADDLHVTNALIHMDGTKVMGRLSDLTGAPHGLSTDQYILYYSEEFRGSFGHVGLLGLRELLMPMIGGARGTPYSADVLKIDYLDSVRAQGGIGGFVHPYNTLVDNPDQAAASDIPVHVALGRGDFYDVISIASLERPSTELYYRLLNCGFRLAATGGTDNFSDVWRDPSFGTARTFAHLDGPLSFEGWIDAVRRGRTFASSAPLLLFELEGKGAGEEIRLTADDPSTLEARLEVWSLVPLDKVEIIVNGRVAHSIEPQLIEGRFELALDIELPGSGWVAARAEGPPHRYVGDAFPFAQTSPIHVVRAGKTFTSAADGRFLLEAVERLWQRVERRDTFRTATQKRAYESAINEAREIYQRIIDNADR